MSKEGFMKLIKETKEDMFSQALVDAFKVNKLDLAENFHKSQPFFYDKNCLWWLWNKEKKLYEIIDETDLVVIIDNNLGRVVPLLKDRREIVEALKIVGRKKIPKDIPINWIQFKDCIYDIKKNKKINSSSEYFCVNPIPWNLGDKTETPKLDELFSEWVKTKEEVNLLYEILAYSLYPAYPISRIFCLYGKGSNGKSVYLNILSKFLGEDNCCSTSLESLITNRFEGSKLYKKLACKLSEIHDRTLSKTSLLKNISGGDSISIEFKNKNPFDKVVYSKIIIGTNTIPITEDDTDGFFRRWIVIDFPNQFSEKRDILAEIEDKEYENLGFKCIKILKKILSKREFSFEGSIEERKKRYNERANPIESFISDRCKHDVDSDVVFSDLYYEFEKYLSNKRFRSVNKREFGKSLRNIGFEIRKKTLNGFFSTYVEGIKVLETTETTETTVPQLSLRIGGANINMGCFGSSGSFSDDKKKSLSEINNEIGENLLHDSDDLLNNLEDL